MTLAAVYNRREAALRADLQQYFGIDLDHAMNGRHTPHHVACLAVNLPQSARCIVAEDADMAWGLPEVLLASLLNSLNGLIWGMGDPKRRGKQPELVGPSRLTEGGKKTLPTRAMPISELMEILNRPRSDA